MKEYILVCSCLNQEKKAKEAFSLLFPDSQMPEVVKGRDRLYKLAKSLGNEHLLAVSKLSGRFSYYVELDKGNNITKEYDLMKGTRIA